ncbi:MAG TPA: hypothetical protein VFQ07_07440 [Candidatus Polarisedimenticolia bacterium]|nr:hypothetical protein [Candidatus Polarisedimenticolia bacterium]
MIVSIRTFPRPFDWTRTVISALASRKSNPGGGLWFAAGLGVGLALLWPVAVAVSSRGGATGRAALRAGFLLRAGLLCGMLVAVERIVFFHFSDLVHKGHEALAVVAFLGIYAGEVGLELDHARRRISAAWMAALVLLPLVAAAGVLLLYLEQRHLGWLDHDGSGGPLPVWLRFPFWQWLALVTLWAGFGHLLSLVRETDAQG